MAKNKTSKFGVAEGLQYEVNEHIAEPEGDHEQPEMKTTHEMKQILEEMKQIANTISSKEAEPQTKRKQGRPPKKEEEKLRGYRYNLNLDKDLKPFLDEIVWQKRTSITQYINDLIRSDMEKSGFDNEG